MATAGQVKSTSKLMSKHSKSAPRLLPAIYQTNRSIMAKKYKLFNDGSKPFIETSTLLQPSNRVVAWADGEEKKEIASVLQGLRKKHDDVKKQVIKREIELREMKVRKLLTQKQLEALEELDMNSQNRAFQMHQKVDYLELELQRSRMMHEEESLMTDTYMYMKTRIKQDLIKMKIKSNKQEESLKSKQQLFQNEIQRQRKTNAGKIRSKNVLNGLMKNIGQELKNQKNRMQDLHKSIKNKEDAVQRRLERIKRQHEIAEAAANQNKDSSEIQMRGSLLINKLWNGFLKRKMEREMVKAVDIEDAFQRIKAATGLIDVQDIVHKFLTREQTYSQLLVAIGEAEHRIDQAKQKNEDLGKQLHSLRINNQGENVRILYDDVNALNKEKQASDREYQLMKERSQKAQIIYDQVSGWAYRNLHKLQSTITGASDFNERQRVPQAFKKIAQIVEEEMRALRGQAEDEYLQHPMPLDYMFEEFLHKNIRVKPLTGKEDEGREANQSRGPGMLSQADLSEEEGDNFNKIADLEMEEQRNLIKQKIRDFQKDEVSKKKKGDKNGRGLNDDLNLPPRPGDFRSKSKPSLHGSPYRL